MTIIKDWADNVLNLQNRFTPSHSAFPRSFSNWDEAEDYLTELCGDYYDDERGEYYIETINKEDILK